jgi:hypothetical protein
MADTKISALPASTVPLAGTEVLPIVQSSTTKQVSVANLTAGRAISATQVTVSTGSVIIGTSGQGIDFSATSHPAGMTSELLADYEEGTWTPVFSTTGTNFTSVTYINQTGRYTKIGDVVYVAGSLYTSAATIGSASGDLVIAGLPFTVNATRPSALSFSQSFNFLTNQPFAGQFRGGNTHARMYYRIAANGNSSTMGFAELNTSVNNNSVEFSGFYYV